MGQIKTNLSAVIRHQRGITVWHSAQTATTKKAGKCIPAKMLPKKRKESEQEMWNVPGKVSKVVALGEQESRVPFLSFFCRLLYPMLSTVVDMQSLCYPVAESDRNWWAMFVRFSVTVACPLTLKSLKSIRTVRATTIWSTQSLRLNGTEWLSKVSAAENRRIYVTSIEPSYHR